jgi:hypothetical protein
VDLTPFFVSIVSLVVGSGLTYGTTALTARSAAKREDAREKRADEARKHAVGREHAAAALAIIRPAQTESWKRKLDSTSYDLDLSDLRLDVAAAEIDLIPDAVLRPRLAGTLSVVRFPWTLANSSYGDGPPGPQQRRGLWLLREALAAYLREEPTPDEPDELGKLANDNDAAHMERDEFDAEHNRRTT